MHALMLLGAVARRRIARMRRHATRSHDRRRDERGFVLVFAMLIMAAVLVVTVAISAGAFRVNHQSARETSTDRASAAADAGAQVALFRLNATGGSTGQTGTIGPGATYTYAITTLANSGSSCAGLWVQNASLQQDCITSTGTVNGVSQRVQERVVSYTPGVSLFPVNGVFAISYVSVSNTVSGSAVIASNATSGNYNFSISSNQWTTFTGKVEYLAADPPYFAQTPSCSPGCLQSMSSAISPPTFPASTWTSLPSTTSDTNDAAISWPSGDTYNASSHTVYSSANNATVNIPAGTYYFCELDLGGGATINTTSWPVKIYIDSSSDPGKCTGGGSGNLQSANAFTIANSSNVSSHVQLYFYGAGSACGTSCPYNLPGNTTTGGYLDLFAPYSSWASTSLNTTGVAVVGYMSMQGTMTFNYQAPSAGDYPSATASFYPAGHANCLPPSTPGGTSGTC
jgi:hypothetical protein